MYKETGESWGSRDIYAEHVLTFSTQDSLYSTTYGCCTLETSDICKSGMHDIKSQNYYCDLLGSVFHDFVVPQSA